MLIELKQVKKAFEANAYGVKNILESSFAYNCKLIHISTDYVFEFKQKKLVSLIKQTINIW